MAKRLQSTGKKLSQKVALESMSFARARKLLDKEGFSRVVIVRRDELDPRKIISIAFHEAG
jgi:hypothetical protein